MTLSAVVSDRPMGDGGMEKEREIELHGNIIRQMSEHECSFREQVYLVALSALITTHPNWLEACLVTSAERIVCMTPRITDGHTT